MSFQILEIVLYSNTGKTRILPLRTNSVNIITGASKTGKSAILHIVSYCLGDKKSEIPEGVILEKTSWFGVHLIREEEELFVARRNPEPGKLSSEDIYIEKGSKLQVPDYHKLTQNSNRDTLITLLNQFAGISDYSFEKKPGQTRNTGVADIGKALIYCFQEQGEIANRRLLFHRQGEQFLPQSIRDYMPFFLGAIDRDHVLKKEEVRRLKQELRRLESNKAEQERMRGTFFERAHSLIAEAVSVDLLPTNQQMPHSWQEVKEGLTAAINAKAEQAFPETQYTLELEKLFELQGHLRDKHRAISEEMAALRALKSGGQGFTHEATEQRTRLSSIGLLPAGEESISSVCPLCSSTLSTPAPNAEAIHANLQAIMHHLEGVSSDFPHIDKLIANAEAKQAEINAELRNLNSRILAIQKVNKRIEVIRDSNAKRALIQGRLGLYLETISDVKDAAEDNKEIELLRSRIQALEMSLADETLQERLDSVLSLLSKEMSDMARTLDLEHSIYPMRLDTNKLTVVADTENGPLPLERMGSGENWVSIHIITYLVLHRWFARKRLPVPNFIFFDQPTQAYFPPDVSDETVRNTDRESVMRMFQLISDKVKDAGFQVIIMDHADIQEDWYQVMITEKWWDGVRKLVPLDWMRNK